MIQRKTFIATLAAAVCGLLPLAAQAQAPAWPGKPIRIVVPYAPGGTTDIVARRMAQKMGDVLGQSVFVENKAGGNTNIGAETVARSPADGYTLLFTNDTTFVANPVLFKQLPYNVQRDFAAVATVTYVPLVLAVSTSTPANSMQELVAYVKSQKSLGYGSFGAGSQPHMLGEMFKKLSGTDLVHVPYRGAGPAVTDVLAGQVLMTFPAFPTIQGHVTAGKMKILGVSGDKRIAVMPNVPTFTEAGFKDMDMGAWYAFLAPAGTPREVVAKLNTTVNAILKDADFVEKNFSAQGISPMISTPEQMTALMQKETATIAEMVRKTGARAE